MSRISQMKCEPLELRRLLAAINVVGTSGVDTITIDWIPGSMLVTLNGSTSWYDDSTVDRFDIFGQGSGDTIDIEYTSDNLIVIDAGDGSDTIRLTPRQRNLGALDADITVRGGIGTDRILFDDSAVPAGGPGESYDLEGNVFQRSPFSNPVRFFDVEEVTISGGARDDFFFISNDDVPVTVNGGGGDDILTLGSLTGDLSLDNSALVTFDGEAGLDEVRVNDWASTANSTYGIDTEPLIPGLTFLGRLGFGGLDTFNNELFLLEASDGDNRIELNSVLGPGTTVNVKGNDGDDRLVIGGRTGKLSDVPAIVTFDGGSSTLDGNNAVELIDLGNTSASTYTITSTNVSFPGFGQLSYSDTDELELDAGPNVSTISVHSTIIPVTVNGGGGSDIIRLGDLTNRLSDLQSFVTATGGTGDSDSITVFDQSGSEASELDIDEDRIFWEAIWGVGYSEFEQLTINNGNPLGSTILMYGLTTPLTVNGGSGPDQLRTSSLIGEEDLSRFSAPIAFKGAGGVDTVWLSDELSIESDDYLVTNTSITHPGFGGLSYTGVDELYLYASDGNNAITVDSTALGTEMYIYGGIGNDAFRVASAGRDLEAIRDFLLVAGGTGGSDSVVFYDSLSTSSQQTAVEATRLLHPNAGPFDFYDFESFVFEAGSGNDVIDISGTMPFTVVTARGGGGSDQFRVGYGAGVLGLGSLPGRVHVEGGAGTNTAVLSDEITSDNATFTVTATQINRPGFGGLVYSDLSTLTVEAGVGNNTFTVNSTSGVTDIRLKGNGGDDFYEVNATIRPVIIDAGAGSGNVINSLPGGSTSMVLENNQTLHSLTLVGDVRASIAGTGTSVLTQFLNLFSGARLDVGRGGVIVNYTGSSPLSSIRSSITSGYASGAWNGIGINSSAAATNPAFAVGYAEASDVLGASGGTFLGRSVDATAVLIRQTRYGDANLDGVVALADFNRMASNFGAGTALWSQGNFNFDSVINLLDFNRLAANFGLTA